MGVLIENAKPQEVQAGCQLKDWKPNQSRSLNMPRSITDVGSDDVHSGGFVGASMLVAQETDQKDGTRPVNNLAGMNGAAGCYKKADSLEANVVLLFEQGLIVFVLSLA